MYKVRLEIGKDTFKQSAKTIEEAIEKLGYSPSALTGKLFIEENGVEVMRIMYPRVLRKLTVNKAFRDIVAKFARVMIKDKQDELERQKKR